MSELHFHCHLRVIPRGGFAGVRSNGSYRWSSSTEELSVSIKLLLVYNVSSLGLEHRTVVRVA